MKVPNDLVDKYAKLFTTNEQWIAVLELIKKSYNNGYEDGRDEMYAEMMG